WAQDGRCRRCRAPGSCPPLELSRLTVKDRPESVQDGVPEHLTASSDKKRSEQTRGWYSRSPDGMPDRDYVRPEREIRSEAFRMDSRNAGWTSHTPYGVPKRRMASRGV